VLCGERGDLLAPVDRLLALQPRQEVLERLTDQLVLALGPPRLVMGWSTRSTRSIDLALPRPNHRSRRGILDCPVRSADCLRGVRQQLANSSGTQSVGEVSLSTVCTNELLANADVRQLLVSGGQHSSPCWRAPLATSEGEGCVPVQNGRCTGGDHGTR
jgi:hypothetical protein